MFDNYLPQISRDARLSRMDKPLRLAVLVVFLFFVALEITSFWQADTSRLVTAFADDAYFYLEIARNTVHTGQLSFNGRTHTNGFHPLWMGILLPLFALARDPIVALRLVGSGSALLLGVSGYMGLRYVSSRFPLISFCVSSLVMMKFLAVFTEYSMETSILIPLCVAALVLMSKVNLSTFGAVRPGQALLLGIMLSLIQLARLDAVFLNCAMLVFLGFMSYRGPKPALNLTLLALPSLVTGSVYLAANRIAFGHFMPVSAVSKSMGTETLNRHMLAQLSATRSLEDVTNLWTICAVLMIASGAYLVVFFRKHRVGAPRAVSSSESYVAGIVSLFFLAFVAYHLLFTSWRLWEWYTYPALLAAIFVLPNLAASIEEKIGRRGAGRRWWVLGGVVIGVVTVLLMCVATLKWGLWSTRNVENNFQYQNYRLALSLNDELEGTPLLAMGDRAGSFAYFFKGSVLQLEGLVGDYELLDAIKENTLQAYMTSSGVEYVAAYGGPPEDYEQWTMLTRTPHFSSGPHAEIHLCRETEILRQKTPARTFILWTWPSCKR